MIVALALMGRGSYPGIIEFLRDLLGGSISLGTVHAVLRSAAAQAGMINRGQDPSRIRIGLHDDIFQGGTPVLAGVCADATYCYLLAAADHRDADTWGVHLLDAAERGRKPDDTIADAGQGLRAGQKAAWSGRPCHGDIFHLIRQCESLANTLARLANGATSRRRKLAARIDRARPPGLEDAPVGELARVWQTETQAQWLACDVRTLSRWLACDGLALAGPDLATRQVLFDFIAAELERLEPADVRRIPPVRVALRNQRDDLPTFADVRDDKLAGIARTLAISLSLVREACIRHRLPTTSTAYWQGWNRLRAEIGGKFHAVFDAVSQVMARTARSSALVENRNARLRTCFTLRRHLRSAYPDLLRFFLNHRRFMRSRLAERLGKSPRELMTGESHPHWRTQLGLGPLQNQHA